MRAAFKFCFRCQFAHYSKECTAVYDAAAGDGRLGGGVGSDEKTPGATSLFTCAMSCDGAVICAAGRALHSTPSHLNLQLYLS
jgi:hypothetical protein